MATNMATNILEKKGRKKKGKKQKKKKMQHEMRITLEMSTPSTKREPMLLQAI
jgi:hypothetical protein